MRMRDEDVVELYHGYSMGRVRKMSGKAEDLGEEKN